MHGRKIFRGYFEANRWQQRLVILTTIYMIALQSATTVPDPQSVPANAPEHCPVSSQVPP